MGESMNATDTREAVDADRALKAKHRAMWALGDYPAVAREIIPELGPVLVQACGVQRGDRVLDVAAGTGNAAIPAALAGARVVASDLTPELLDTGRQLAQARGADVEWRQADAEALPFADGEFDVVVAGEVLEHVEDLDAVVYEALRVLRPGGTFVCDTLNATWAARVVLVWIGERVPGGPPLRCHDPRLFVRPERLRSLCASGGVELELWGVRPRAGQYAGFLRGRRDDVEMVRTRSLALTYQGRGVKR